MTSVSVFTPTNDPSFLRQAYASMKDQDFDEWVILYNGGAEPLHFSDDRVKSHVIENAPPFVGALKAEACARARCDVLLELDHDDLLLPGAVGAVKEAFADERVGFVYSNAVRATASLGKTERFIEGNGWQYRPFEYKGHALDEVVAFEPTPAAMSRIWFAPDHLRAFRRDVYERVGGHARDMRVLDDHDLMCRMWPETEFAHIDAPLYLYRVHGGNTWLKHNAEIQDNALRLHDKYSAQLAMTWATRQGLRKLDLGARLTTPGGYETVDRKDADIVCDLDGDWPFAGNSVGVIRAFDIFEHLKDPLHTMREAYRVLAPGGWIFCQVPSTDGRGAFQDPTHKSFWNENSFLYYTHQNWGRYIDTPVRFQAPRLYTTVMDERQVCWTNAHLISLKDGYRPPGQVFI